MSGPQPLSPSDVLAWSRLSGNVISPLEFSILQDLDSVYREEVKKFLEEQSARRDDYNSTSRGALRK